jgi:O-acetyl-ADP-ribose deacetylase (regulator of RNase III)
LAYLIQYLLHELPRDIDVEIPDDAGIRFQLFRSLVNRREAKPIDDAFLKVQDAYLQTALAEKGITDIATLQPVEEGIYLWKGDITTLKCGAIVNAANSGMTGCYQPCHSCIDNAIHTFAGVQLRLECAEQMAKQGHEEPSGHAKLTQSYNLPCDFILHTVGPIVQGTPTWKQCQRLRQCYWRCMELATKNQIPNVAFCCISTGVFGFPQQEAAEIAVETVREYRRYFKEMKVIFNVFKQEDYDIYRKLLG